MPANGFGRGMWTGVDIFAKLGSTSVDPSEGANAFITKINGPPARSRRAFRPSPHSNGTSIEKKCADEYGLGGRVKVFITALPSATGPSKRTVGRKLVSAKTLSAAGGGVCLIKVGKASQCRAGCNHRGFFRMETPPFLRRRIITKLCKRLIISCLSSTFHRNMPR